MKESDVKIARNFQSISMFIASPRKKPIKDLMAIIIKDVPTATFISTFAKMTNAGIIKNPPPAPIKPVMLPTKRPSNKING